MLTKVNMPKTIWPHVVEWSKTKAKYSNSIGNQTSSLAMYSGSGGKPKRRVDLS